MQAVSLKSTTAASSALILLALARVPRSTFCGAWNPAVLTWRAHLLGRAMAAYALVNVEIKDSAGFAEYRGRFLTRGGATEVLEGEWIPNRLVVLDFPDVAAIKAWYYSPEFQQPL